MNVINYSWIAVLCLCVGLASVSCGKLKFVAIKRPHWGFVGVKVRTPKFLGLGHGGGFGLGGHGGGFGGGSSHHHEEHHEYHHESHHSSGGFGGSWWGK